MDRITGMPEERIMTGSYRHCDPDDRHITLHDCHAEKMSFHNGILSFVFPDGFWITQYHSLNDSGNTVRTNSSQVDFQIVNGEIEGIEIYVFSKNRKGKIIRDEWEPLDMA